MPLIWTVKHHIPLAQQQVLAVGHRVHGALIYIGKLQHGVRLAGEEETLLLFMVEEGVKVGDPKSVADIQIQRHGAGTYQFRRLLSDIAGGDLYGRF